MDFQNIQVKLNLNSKNTDKLDIDLKNFKNLEKGDKLDLLINNIENYYLNNNNNNNNISFDKNNISLHKLKDENDKCLWSNDVLRKNKNYEDLDIEDNSIYCLKIKNNENNESNLIPVSIKSGFINNIDKKINVNCVHFDKDNNIYKFMIITEKSKLYFLYDIIKQKIIIDKCTDLESKLIFESNIELNINENIIENYGKGKITFLHGIIYDGKFNFITLHNFYFSNGKAIYPNGKIMEGIFIQKNNKTYLLNGKITFPDGKIMEGEFNKSLFIFDQYFLLKGIHKKSDNYIEEGIFHGNRLLKGKITTSKHIFEGIFDSNNILIDGKMFDKNNNLIEEGIFHNGYLIKGKKIKKNKIYEGIFDNFDLIEGKITNNKRKYVEEGLFDENEILISGNRKIDNYDSYNLESSDEEDLS